MALFKEEKEVLTTTIKTKYMDRLRAIRKLSKLDFNRIIEEALERQLDEIELEIAEEYKITRG